MLVRGEVDIVNGGRSMCYVVMRGVWGVGGVRFFYMVKYWFCVGGEEWVGDGYLGG